MSVVFPVLPDLADELGVSRGRIGLVQGAVAVPGIFLATYTGYLADRFGRRTVIRWSLLIFGFAGVASLFARSFWPLIATRLVQGLGTSGLMSLGVVVIGDMFVGLERRWAMGMNIAAVTGTTALAPVFGGLLAEGGAFRPFLLTTLAFPLWFFASALPDKPADPVTTRPFVHFRSALDDLRQNRRIGDFLGVLPMSLITLGSFVGLGLTVTPLFLERVFDVSVSRRGFIMAFGAGASSLTSLLAGRIGARIQRGRILMVAFGLMTAGVHRPCDGSRCVGHSVWAGDDGYGNGLDIPDASGLHGVRRPCPISRGPRRHLGVSEPARPGNRAGGGIGPGFWCG